VQVLVSGVSQGVIRCGALYLQNTLFCFLWHPAVGQRWRSAYAARLV